MKWVGDPILFVLLYVAAAVTMAPAFVLSVAAGALFGVWRGSLLVFVSATLGAMAAYGVARAVTGTRFVKWVMRDRRVEVVRRAVAHRSVWVQFLLRLSPIVPYVLLNYALGFSRVRIRDFLVACFGMIPTIVMYVYYGRVVGDVAKIAAGVAPPRGREYYVLLVVGLMATVVATMVITRAARRAIELQRLHQ
ncbi:MAG: TVP38/TMEM64 family protein [Gammaproteobacteria bacterium]|nr:MAG: TVP38/TMEM64 family protein [Gammaproteobacteria bacterium]